MSLTKPIFIGNHCFRGTSSHTSHDDATMEERWAAHEIFVKDFLAGKAKLDDRSYSTAPLEVQPEALVNHFNRISLIAVYGERGLSALAIIAGLALTLLDDEGNSRIDIIGLKIDTGSVGIAAIALGVFTAIVLLRQAMSLAFASEQKR